MKKKEELDPGHLPTRPPESLTFTSLAEIYRKYLELFIGKEFKCPRGTPIVFDRDNFFHLVKLETPGRVICDIKEEEPLILATTKDFGEYTINTKRAATLSWIPDILTAPHEIWEYEKKKTADEVFIREYDKSGSPFRAVLLLREKGYLRPVTCMTVRRTGIKEHRKGRKLWPPEK